MQNEKTTGEIEHNIPGGELVLVLMPMLVIESKARNQRSEVRDQKSKIDHAVNPKLVMARSYDAALQHTSCLR